MYHHLSLGVRDLARAGTFYDAILGPLGFRRVFDGDESIGYGLVDNEDFLLLNLCPDATPPGEGFHLGFAASSHAEINAFHSGGLAAGGRDNGPPGLRPEYGAHYYAAFLVDPDGHHVEAVINVPVTG